MLGVLPTDISRTIPGPDVLEEAPKKPPTVPPPLEGEVIKRTPTRRVFEDWDDAFDERTGPRVIEGEASRVGGRIIRRAGRILGPIGGILDVLIPSGLDSGELTPEQMIEDVLEQAEEPTKRLKERLDELGTDIARGVGVAAGGLGIGGAILLGGPPGGIAEKPPEPPPAAAEPESPTEQPPEIAQERRSSTTPDPAIPPERESAAPTAQPLPAPMPSPATTPTRGSQTVPRSQTGPLGVPNLLPAALAAVGVLTLSRARPRTATRISPQQTVTPTATPTPVPTPTPTPTAPPAPPLTPVRQLRVESAEKCPTPKQQRKDDRKRRQEKRKQCKQFLSIRVPAHKRKMCIGDLAKYLQRKLERTLKRAVRKKIIAELEERGVPATALIKATKRPRKPKAEVEVGGVEIDLGDLLEK